MAQLNALNELLSGVQRSIAMGVPGLEERRGQIMSDIQLLLLGPQQVQEPAPAATGAVYYFSDGHTPVSPPLAPVTQAYTMRAPRPNMPPASLAAAQAPQTEAPQAPLWCHLARRPGLRWCSRKPRALDWRDVSWRQR
jgi:hypothetical protein